MPFIQSKTNPRSDRYFFPIIALWFIAVAHIGFSSAMESRDGAFNLEWSVLLHAGLYTTWLFLFLVQALLIGIKKPKVHMALGQVTLVMAILMAVSALYVSVYAIENTGGTMLGQQFKIVLLFLTFIVLGLRTRKQPSLHKRYMTFSMISIMSPAVFRIDMWGINDSMNTIGLVLMIPTVALILYDLLSTKSINKATLVGAVLSFVVGRLANQLFASDSWQSVVQKLSEITA